MKKVLVTGATGFIGKYLYRKLKELKYDVTGISFEGGKIDGDKIIALDITNKETVERFFIGKKFKIIFHLAAFIPKKTENRDFKKNFNVNCLGTYNLLVASEKNKIDKFVYSSSASIYNRQTVPMPAKEEFANPENIYGISKLAAENLCELFRRNYNLKTVSLRYSSVYGMGQEPYCVLPIFIEKVFKNEAIKVFGSGKRTQDFIYVKDVVDANIKAAFSRAEGVFNVGSGREISTLKLARTIIKVFSKSKSKIKKEIVTAEDKTRLFLDAEKAKKGLKFSAKYSLEKGLSDYKKLIYENRDNS